LASLTARANAAREAEEKSDAIITFRILAMRTSLAQRSVQRRCHRG